MKLNLNLKEQTAKEQYLDLAATVIIGLVKLALLVGAIYLCFTSMFARAIMILIVITILFGWAVMRKWK